MNRLQNKRFLYRNVLKQAFCFSIALILLMGEVSFFGQGTKVVGTSMENTFMEGDSLFIDKLSYHFIEPKRFDIIVFPFKEKEETLLYIKRIIGLPGETIQIAGNAIYIDGEVLEESYGKEAMEEGTEGIALKPYTLEEDEYFVLGDNRNYSIDSRHPHVGPIKRDLIIGKSAFRLW